MKLSDYHIYDNGYIGLVIPVTTGLPDSLFVQGEELTLKTEFHITLINAGAIATLIDKDNSEKIKAEIVTEFKDFVKNQPLEDYKILHIFRLVQRDVRKTVIAQAVVPHLVEFFDRLRRKYKVAIPDQPTHVTMYALRPERGIGILSEEELDRDSQSIEPAELANL